MIARACHSDSQLLVYPFVMHPRSINLFMCTRQCRQTASRAWAVLNVLFLLEGQRRHVLTAQGGHIMDYVLFGIIAYYLS